MKSAECVACGITFAPKNYSTRKYCSRDCYNAYRASPRTVCDQCGISFAANRNKRCSQACRDAWRASPRERTEKHCPACETTKPLSEFQPGSKKASWDGLHGYCRPCEQQRMRAYMIQRNYGITVEEYERMLADQGGVCAICGTSEASPGGKKAWAVDHDHATGEVRGILCNRCNTGIGQLGDDPDRLVSAAAYLIRSQDVLRHGLVDRI